MIIKDKFIVMNIFEKMGGNWYLINYYVSFVL